MVTNIQVKHFLKYFYISKCNSWNSFSSHNFSCPASRVEEEWFVMPKHAANVQNLSNTDTSQDSVYFAQKFWKWIHAAKITISLLLDFRICPFKQCWMTDFNDKPIHNYFTVSDEKTKTQKYHIKIKISKWSVRIWFTGESQCIHHFLLDVTFKPGISASKVMVGLNIVTKIMGPENLNILSVGQISHVPWYKLYRITLKDSFGKYYLKILICIICWIYYLNNV